MGRELKETERNVNRNQAQPQTDEVSRKIVISGPMPDNRETQAMTITSVRIRGTEIGSMTGIEKGVVSIEHREDLKPTSEIPIPILTEVKHRGEWDLQEGVMSLLGIERKGATTRVALKIQKIQSPGTGGTKRGEVLAGQSVTGIGAGK